MSSWYHICTMDAFCFMLPRIITTTCMYIRTSRRDRIFRVRDPLFMCPDEKTVPVQPDAKLLSTCGLLIWPSYRYLHVYQPSLSLSLSLCMCVCVQVSDITCPRTQLIPNLAGSLCLPWTSYFPPPPQKTNKTCFHRHPATTHPLSPGQQFSRPSEGSHDDVEMRRNDAYPPAWGDTAEHDRLTARSKGSSPTPHPPPLPFPVVRYPDAMPRLRKQNGPMVDPRMVSIPG